MKFDDDYWNLDAISEIFYYQNYRFRCDCYESPELDLNSNAYLRLLSKSWRQWPNFNSSSYKMTIDWFNASNI